MLKLVFESVVENKTELVEELRRVAQQIEYGHHPDCKVVKINGGRREIKLRKVTLSKKYTNLLERLFAAEEVYKEDNQWRLLV